MKQSLYTFSYFLHFFALFFPLSLANRCNIPNIDKDICGPNDISKERCESVGCCYDPQPFDPWEKNQMDFPVCYHGVFMENISPNVNPATLPSFRPTTAAPTAPFVFFVTTTPTTTSTTSTTPSSATTTASTTEETSTVAPKTTTPPPTRTSLSLLQILQMKRNNVPQNVINSLIADAIPNGELLYFLRDGQLDNQELLKLSGGNELSLNPVFAQYLTGSNMQGLIYQNLAKAYDVNPTLIQLLMNNNTNPIVKHLAARFSRQSKLNPMTSFILSSLLSGGIKQGNVKNFMVDQALKHETFYSRQALKSLLKGDKNDALRWAFLSANQKRIPLSYYYPKELISFAYLVDSQKLLPKSVRPSVILALALNESIPGIANKTFDQLFGVKANDYVCASHDLTFRVKCRKLENQLYLSTLDCIQAGCCPSNSKQTPDFQCFENVLGKIGVGLAQKVWNDEYVVKEVFGGKLPTFGNFYPNGIPWLPPIKTASSFPNIANVDPSQPNWVNSMMFNNAFIRPFSTTIPLLGKRLRPNFIWKPHGPTSFPTLLPGGKYPIATNSPGIIVGTPAAPAPVIPSIFPIPPIPQSVCKAVRKDDRRLCMANTDALAPGGEVKCKALDCCFDPIWNDFSVPICFRSVSYGQCYNVPYTQRVDCGTVGISREDCLKNQSCCYDSTINSITLETPVPWCYFKLHTFVDSSRRCPLVDVKVRQPCFPEKFNPVISKATCEEVGCCYEEVNLSYLVMTVTNMKRPPTCYKLPVFPLFPTDPPPTTTTVAAKPKTCAASFRINPRLRVDCKASTYKICVFDKGCCFKRNFFMPYAPWCFYKS